LLHYIIYFTVNLKLINGKTPREHSLHGKTAASVLLKLFISDNGTFSNVHNIQSMIPEDQKSKTTK